MSIKILGGLAKSRSLLVPKGQKIRPTSVLLKRRVFDSRQDLSDDAFFDLCAGTGAMGLEAWSRGARSVYLNEPDREVFNLLKKNIETVKGSEQGHDRPIKCTQLKVEKIFQGLTPDPAAETSIYFLDPPYEMHNVYKKVGLHLLESIQDGVEVWIESDKDKGLPVEFWEQNSISPFKVFKQGGSYLALFAKR